MFDKGYRPDMILFCNHINRNFAKQGEFMLSQWYPSPFSVNEIVYKSAGHWMVARKALLIGDRESFKRIINIDRFDEAKAIVPSIEGFDESQWDEYKYDVVREGNFHKFNQNRKLREYLLSTGDAILAEANPNDNIWGIGLSKDSKNVADPYAWNGSNLLGFALMEIRDYLRQLADADTAKEKSRNQRTRKSAIF
jgi:ribA/ribD-fused uncharacterized protein